MRVGLYFVAALVVGGVACSYADPPAAGAIDTLVVCPAEFRAALQPWLVYRQSQGHRIGLLSNEPTGEQIQAAIRREAKSGTLKYVVLVGDADPELKDDDQVRARCVPTSYVPSQAIHHYGGERSIATDSLYADLDGDGATELAVGRLPVDTPRQLSSLIERIMAYEKNPDFGPWRRRINLVAGAGDFGPLLDPLVESTAREFLASGVPAEYQTTMTYGNWRSPFCPDPRRFAQSALTRINEGCLFWVYMGHAQVNELEPLSVPGAKYPVLSPMDVRNLATGGKAPVALMFCCYAGAFDARVDCLAEQLVCQPGGPVAALAGSRMTMPYGMATLASQLLDACFVERCETIGEMAMRGRNEVLRDGAANARRKWLDQLATLASPSRKELPQERQDHAALFNLLGDPLMRIPRPQPVTLEVARRGVVGQRLEVSGRSPVAGPCVLELIVRRDRLTFTPPQRLEYTNQQATLAAFQQVYDRANDPCILRQELNVPLGEFRAAFDLPPDCAGACHVRAFVCNGQACAAGSSDVRIVNPPPPTAPVAPPATAAVPAARPK